MIQTKYRVIETKIPHDEDLKLIKEIDKVEPYSTHQNLPIVWDYAKDFQIYDRWGNKFIDFTSGIFVTNTGHDHIKSNLTESKLIYTYTFPTEIKLKFLQKLTMLTNFDKAFLLSSGAESVEAAVKIMRMATKRKKIIAFKGSMHGKTSLGENLKGDYKWVTKDIHIAHLPFPEFNNYNFNDDLKKYSIEIKDMAGFLVESYRGWDAQFFPKNYIQELVQIANKNDVLVCFDEIQGGFGRTGKLFAYEHYDISKPDLVCTGKALGGGVPISAVLGRKELLDIPDDLSSTYSGNPLVCNGALSNLMLIEKFDLIEESKRKGKILELIKEFIKYKIVERINCIGLLGAVVFRNKDIAEEVCLKCLQNGILLVKTGRESIKLGPPLTIKDDALKEGIFVIKKIVEEINERY